MSRDDSQVQSEMMDRHAIWNKQWMPDELTELSNKRNTKWNDFWPKLEVSGLWFGQFWPIHFWPIHFCVVLWLWLVLVYVVVCCWFGPSPPDAGPSSARTAEIFAFFSFSHLHFIFSLSLSHYRSFCLSLGVFSLNFGWCFQKAGTLKCART